MNLLQDFPPLRTTARTDGGARPLSILVVEDSRSAADILGLFCESEGYTARVAYDGHEAVKLAMLEQPDVILMDLGMPGLNGLEAVREIRRMKGAERIAIIALSGFDDEDDLRLCREGGFHAHIAKPADPLELAAMLRKLR